MTARSISTVRMEIARALAAVSETAGLDAQVLLAHVLGRSRGWILAHGEVELTAPQQAQIERLTARLKMGEPLPYVLGHWEFFGIDFTVTPDVLIPRPETELLVEQALAWLQAHPERRWAADVGAGSGCISVALAVHCPDVRLLALDLSAPALGVAAGNARRHGVQAQVGLVQADLLPAAPASLDLVCANPPYIPSPTVDGLPISRWEPRLALDGGPTGLEVIERLLSDAQRALTPGGLLLMEIEARQRQPALALGRRYFPTAQVEVLPDLAGRDRLLKIKSR